MASTSTRVASKPVSRVLWTSAATSYVCRTCRSKPLPSSPAARSPIRCASSTVLAPRSAIFLSRSRQRRGLFGFAEKENPERLQKMEFSPLQQPPQEDEYQEAETWDGLEMVGHKGEWQAVEDPIFNEYTPWLKPRQGSPPSMAEMIAYLEEAVLQVAEAETRTEQGQQPVEVGTSTEGFLYIRRQNRAGAGDANLITFQQDRARLAEAKLDFNQPISFEILKTLSQLSSLRITDPLLLPLSRDAEPLSHLLDALAENAKPKLSKVADILQAHQEEAQKPAGERRKGMQKVQDLPANVMVLKSRETPIQKEMQVGRWKVIERELEARGLPTIGRVDDAEKKSARPLDRVV